VRIRGKWLQLFYLISLFIYLYIKYLKKLSLVLERKPSLNLKNDTNHFYRGTTHHNVTTVLFIHYHKTGHQLTRSLKKFIAAYGRSKDHQVRISTPELNTFKKRRRHNYLTGCPVVQWKSNKYKPPRLSIQ